jgi:hypothetical protein
MCLQQQKWDRPCQREKRGAILCISHPLQKTLIEELFPRAGVKGFCPCARFLSSPLALLNQPPESLPETAYPALDPPAPERQYPLREHGEGDDPVHAPAQGRKRRFVAELIHPPVVEQGIDERREDKERNRASRGSSRRGPCPAGEKHDVEYHPVVVWVGAVPVGPP